MIAIHFLELLKSLFFLSLIFPLFYIWFIFITFFPMYFITNEKTLRDLIKEIFS